MNRVCVVCEGQTEVEFIRSCLAPHMMQYDVEVFPSILRSRSGKSRGGHVTVERIVNFLRHQYYEAEFVTTLVDYYGFQDRNDRRREEIEQAILLGVKAAIRDFDERRLIPYVQLHEFEGLLFSDVDCFECVQDGWSQEVKQRLENEAGEFETPEDINDCSETAPSKRILKIFPPGSYSKTEHGPLIAEAIGIDVIRSKCPRFNGWIEKLAMLGR